MSHGDYHVIWQTSRNLETYEVKSVMEFLILRMQDQIRIHNPFFLLNTSDSIVWFKEKKIRRILSSLSLVTNWRRKLDTLWKDSKWITESLARPMQNKIICMHIVSPCMIVCCEINFNMKINFVGITHFCDSLLIIRTLFLSVSLSCFLSALGARE